MPFYNVLLVYAVAKTLLSGGAVALAPAERRPWTAVFQSAADISCALLLRACFDHDFRETLGLWMIPMFLYAATWSARVWLAIMKEMMGSDEGPGETTLLGALGVGVQSGLTQMLTALWHTCFVAPSIVCAAFMLVGLTDELPPR